MSKLLFIMLGGFLGAGKTTTMVRLARFFSSRGQRVALVTNDQAQDLVDTHSLRAQGFSVEEVAGACFCCRFDDLVGKVGALQEGERPDVILAEPVGSCTDLVATVVQPLRDLYGERFEVAPYAVLFKPSHGLKVLRGETTSGLSPKAAYIFKKQLEEADAIVINRVDEIDPVTLGELTGLVKKQFPGVPVLALSAKTGQGFEGLTELLSQQGAFGRKILTIDYDVYAEGEAELGWLNASTAVTGVSPFDLDRLLLEIIGRLREAFAGMNAEVAHLKVIGLSEASFGVANLVSSGTLPELSLPSRQKVTSAEVIVNARVAADPALIEPLVRQTLQQVCAAYQARVEVRSLQSFRPGRPTPTHRYAAASPSRE
jgi:Ni2+-binding GTPase involved in maturation of urease and hydrogenase